MGVKARTWVRLLILGKSKNDHWEVRKLHKL